MIFCLNSGNEFAEGLDHSLRRQPPYDLAKNVEPFCC